MKPQINDLAREPEPCLVAADVSPHDAIPHQRARKFRKLCALPPSPGGEGRGEGERFLQSKIQNPKSKRVSLRRLLRFRSSSHHQIQRLQSAPGKPACSYLLFSETIGLAAVFLAFVFFSACRTSETADSNTAKPQRPNFVFILTDDQRFDSMGCAGNRLIRTPNLDRLAANGVRFRNQRNASGRLAHGLFLRASLRPKYHSAQRRHSHRALGLPPLAGAES